MIAGNGGAALAAVRAIRSVDRVSHIRVISAEDCYAYSPVSLTYYLSGRISRSQLFLTNADFYQGLGVELIRGEKVTEILPGVRVLKVKAAGSSFTTGSSLPPGLRPRSRRNMPMKGQWRLGL